MDVTTIYHCLRFRFYCHAEVTMKHHCSKIKLKKVVFSFKDKLHLVGQHLSGIKQLSIHVLHFAVKLLDELPVL